MYYIILCCIQLLGSGLVIHVHFKVYLDVITTTLYTCSISDNCLSQISTDINRTSTTGEWREGICYIFI